MSTERPGMEKPDSVVNPGALKALANLILRGVQFQEIAIAESLRLCAAAWEQERSEAAALRERIRLLEQWAKRAEETLVYAAIILGPFADKEDGPAKIAMDECDSRFVEYAALPGSPAAASGSAEDIR